MITTAVAADEPPEPQPSFATGGIVPAGSTLTTGGGCCSPGGGAGERVLTPDECDATAGTHHRVIEILLEGEWVDVTQFHKPSN